MFKKKTHWGTALFIFSVVLACVAVYISKVYSPSKAPVFYNKILPFSGLIFCAAAFFAGHFSYPRVHNLKVYMAGYLTGLTGLTFFLFQESSAISYSKGEPAEFFALLCLINLLNFLLIQLIPSFVKYRSARSTTLAVVTVEAVILFSLRFGTESSTWVSKLYFDSLGDFTFWIGPLIFLVIAALSLWWLADEFFLGGVVAGCALIYAIIWTFGIDTSRQEHLQLILFAVSPLYLITGIITHWFSRIENRVAYDPLLQIYNRDFCSKIITEQANLNVTAPFTVAMVDIDHFKNVNDTYGHQAGDAVLYNVAQALCRDAVPQGIVCRYGGEELAIFFPQKTTKEVVPIMEKARLNIEKMKTTSGKKNISVTISCGISHRDNNTQSVMDVIHSADKALYRAKNGGRNLVKSAKIKAAK